ncbi:hypothetical protein CEP14_14705 [Cylindrospermopsis raciborskii C04]|uniref:hypothetical protein n=1 Tax=Cylindrospermopsis raciborskii TaxID=77022 RepID=UPI000CC27D13|nr:hypothetical protein [Cylindrospermopsis raciborskii]PNJ92648.1 hypothetical protein CEP14_14705 [Cylindrospermopsis raciborskii C04]
MASSAFSVDLYELTILPKRDARLEAQVITYAISRRECFTIACMECLARITLTQVIEVKLNVAQIMNSLTPFYMLLFLLPY